MIIPRCLLLAVVLLVLAPVAFGQSKPVRERLSLNADWRFKKDDPSGSEELLSYQKIKDWVNATGNEFVAQAEARKPRPAGNPAETVSYTQRNFDDRSWRQLDLPHDWGIEGPFKQEYPGETGKLPWWGVGWYRKHLTVSASERGKQIYLDIDGAMAYASVWLNGRFVGGWPYGYASFELDLTPYIEFGGDNVIAIRLDNPPDSSRWYPGGGIYRNVWLVKTAPVHVGHWGTFITTTDVSQSAANVNLKVSVDNNSASAANAIVKTQVYELANGQKTGKPVSSSAPIGLTIAGGATAVAARSGYVRA